MTDPVQAAIAAAAAQAQTNAAQGGPSTTSVPAVQNQTGTAVGAASAPVTPGQAFSMDTVGAGTMAVDTWLKVKEFGLFIGDSKALQQKVLVSIDMTDGSGFMVKQGIKGGNPAQYAYTYDGQVANDGKSWELAMARIRGYDAKAAPYPCVDLPMTVSEAVKDKDTVLLEVGKILGYTTSTTNWTNWKLFYAEVVKAGLLGERVEVELTAQSRTNPKGNNWGVVSFKLLGVAGGDNEG